MVLSTPIGPIGPGRVTVLLIRTLVVLEVQPGCARCSGGFAHVTRMDLTLHDVRATAHMDLPPEAPALGGVRVSPP